MPILKKKKININEWECGFNPFRKRKKAHAIWHLFVLADIITHFIGVMLLVQGKGVFLIQGSEFRVLSHVLLNSEL